MFEMVPSMVIMIDMGVYWLISVAVFAIMDLYARKKIGGKQMLGYKVLRMAKFLALIIVSAYTIVLIVIAMNGFTVTNNVLTYLGLPYFIAWIFFLINMLRRVKAETKGKPID